MRILRPVIAAHPASFGRGPDRMRMRGPDRLQPRAAAMSSTLASDARLFGTTFFAGFLFVSLLIF